MSSATNFFDDVGNINLEALALDEKSKDKDKQKKNISKSLFRHLKKFGRGSKDSSASSESSKEYENPLDKYSRSQVIGTGTFGYVFLVQDRTTGKYFAMKELRKEKVIKYKQVAHVKMEKRVLTDVNHVFIVNCQEAFQTPESLFMVMEYVCGGELFSHLRRSGRFTNSTARFYAAEIVLAIEHLHSFHILYRDLKPENLLIGADGHIKVTDFGFAKRVRDKTFTMCGTPEYLAPEVIHGRGYGKSADWWAVGILIYEMLAGFTPFYDENQYRLYEKIIQCRLRFPSHFDPYAKDLLRKLLQPDVTARLGCMRNAVKDIKSHRWFKGVDWVAIEERRTIVPFIPKVRHEGDTSNFIQYDEPPPPGAVKPEWVELFKDF